MEFAALESVECEPCMKSTVEYDNEIMDWEVAVEVQCLMSRHSRE